MTGVRRAARTRGTTVPGTPALLDALELLAGDLPAPGRDVAADGPEAEDAVHRTDLLAVAYRLLFAELATAGGLPVATPDALRGLVTRVVVPPGSPSLAAARATLRVPRAPGPDDVLALGRLHEDVLDWRLVPVDGRWTWRREGRLRKAGGSYFTPAPLVEHLLDETLDPVLRLGPGPGSGTDPTDGLPRVLDPSCGAGAFLVPAARRLTDHARAGGASVAEARRAALGAVHGVDLDPAVLELARVALWLDSLLLATSTASTGPTGLTEPVPDDPVALAGLVLADLALVVGDSVGDLRWGRAFPDVFVDGGRTVGEFELGDFEVGRFAAGEVDAGELAPGGFDVVVGNPPFANQLERLTARRPTTGVRAPAAYTDLSAVFLLQALSWVRTGGRVGLVQPQSLLSSRDAAPVRSAVTAAGALASLWVGESGLFDAAVPTCALVVVDGAEQGAVRRWRGASFERLADRDVRAEHLTREWGFLLAAALGVPEVALVSQRSLGELADSAADFRDQYYGLAPYVRETAPGDAERRAAGEVAPLVTAGLVDPAVCHWGRRSTRFLKQTWQAPVVDLAAMRADEALTAWAGRRLVPKVLLATQGRVLEAWADATGGWLPSVPVVTVVPHDPDDLWRVLAVLLAPPVCAFAATRYAGSGLNPSAIKLSARQVAGLPLPGDAAAWSRGADEVRRAQDVDDPAGRREALLRAGATMATAYGLGTATGPRTTDDLLSWWSARLPRR